MPLLILGVIMLCVSVWMLRRAIRNQDKEGVVGSIALILASLILIFFYGLFYSITIY